MVFSTVNNRDLQFAREVLTSPIEKKTDLQHKHHVTSAFSFNIGVTAEGMVATIRGADMR